MDRIGLFGGTTVPRDRLVERFGSSRETAQHEQRPSLTFSVDFHLAYFLADALPKSKSQHGGDIITCNISGERGSHHLVANVGGWAAGVHNMATVYRGGARPGGWRCVDYYCCDVTKGCKVHGRGRGASLREGSLSQSVSHEVVVVF